MLLKNKNDVVSFFRSSPLCGVDLEIQRDTSNIREIDLITSQDLKDFEKIADLEIVNPWEG